MTSAEKSVVNTFLVLSKAYTGNGYKDSPKEALIDDEAPGSLQVPSDTFQVPGTSLPLAYMVDEDELSSAPILKPLVLVIGAALSPPEMALLTRVLASAGLALGGNCLFIEGTLATAALEDEIRWNMPKAVLCLGDFPVPCQHIPVISTCRPAELLQNEALKRRVFADMKELMLILAKANSTYIEENRELLKKYADADRAFAAAIMDAAPEFLS